MLEGYPFPVSHSKRKSTSQDPSHCSRLEKVTYPGSERPQPGGVGVACPPTACWQPWPLQKERAACSPAERGRVVQETVGLSGVMAAGPHKGCLQDFTDIPHPNQRGPMTPQSPGFIRTGISTTELHTAGENETMTTTEVPFNRFFSRAWPFFSERTQKSPNDVANAAFWNVPCPLVKG